MMNKLKEIAGSKKAIALYTGLLTVVLKDVLELDPEQVKLIVGLVMTYIVGQGVADHGKEKAKIEAAAK